MAGAPVRPSRTLIYLCIHIRMLQTVLDITVSFMWVKLLQHLHFGQP